MGADFLAVIYGLSSAVSWGAGDFSGGLASKRTSVFTVVLISQVVGILLLIASAFAFAEVIPDSNYLVWGAFGGVFGSLGLVALYSALAQSQMGLVAPLSAVVTAIIPVVFAFFSEGLPKTTQMAGFGIALVAVWFLSYSGSKNKLVKKELVLALSAGIGFGLFFIFIDKASSEAVMWPLVSARFASLTLLVIIILFRRGVQKPSIRQIPYIVMAGVFDAGGNALFAMAAHLGRLDVSSVLASLYPASTVLLAWLFLKERLHSQQWIGVVAAFSAMVLIAV